MRKLRISVILSFLAGVVAAHAADPNKKFESESNQIEINSEQPVLSLTNSQHCGEVGLFRVWVSKGQTYLCSSVKRQLSEAQSVKILKPLKPKYDFIAEVNLSTGFMRRIAILNTHSQIKGDENKQNDETDFKSARYRFKNENPSVELFRLVRNFEDFHLHKSALKTLALLAGISQSERLIQKTDASGNTAVIDRKTGKELNPEKAYQIFRDENAEQKHYLTAVLEAGAVLGLGALAYNLVYSNELPNTWRYHFNWESYREKFSSKGVRFDDNWAPFNVVGHPLSGAIYYLMSRSNGLSAMESFLYVFTVSSIWEYLVEFRNEVGLNDMIFTPLTAFALGESMNQLGLLFARSSDTLAHRVLAGIFGQPILFNQWFHQNAPKTSEKLNSLGISTDLWHRFDFCSGVGVHSSKGSLEFNGEFNGTLGFESRIVQINQYQENAKQSHVIWGPEITDLMIHSEWGKGGLDAFTLLTQVVYAGYYSQNISETASQKKTGTSFLVGASTGYELSTMKSLGAIPGVTDDMIGNVRVLGAIAEFDGYFRGAHLKFSVNFFGDFAAIQSFALNRYAAQSAVGLEGLRSVLKTHGYYYANGLTTDAQVALEYGGTETGFNVSYDTFQSIEGLDKNQESATRDYPMTEQRLKREAYLGYRFQNIPVKVRLIYRRTERSGTLQTQSEKIQNSATDQSLQARVIVVF